MKTLKGGGFTLVELLVVIAVTVIIVAIGSLSLFGSRDQSVLNKGTEAVVAVLREAESNSTAEVDGYEWGVVFVNPVSGAGYYTLWENASTTAVTTTYLDPLLSFTAPASGGSLNVCFAMSTGLPIDCVTGAAASSSVSLKASSGATTTITINSTGSISY